jgi:uncharacterized protein
MTHESQIRAAVITCLAEKYPMGNFGRTAVMKLCYFLQTLRRVPLGYRFTLYSYGPFDADVLGDLDYAEAVDAITSKVVHYASGAYGYQISLSKNAEALKTRAKDFLTQYCADIDWVIKQFGDLGSGDLELASTIVFVDREVTHRGSNQSLKELIDRVHAIKPHFSETQVRNLAQKIATDRLLRSLA